MTEQVSAEKSSLPLTVAAFGYCRDDHERLLMVGNNYEGHGVLWGIPGGGLEEGESLEECVVREFAEEVGLEVRVTRDCGTIRRLKPDWELNLEAHFYEVEVLDGVPRVDPHEEHVVAVKFLTRKEIATWDGTVLGRAYILDYLENPENYPRHIVMAAHEE